MVEVKSGWRRVKFGDVVRLSKEACKDTAAEGIERYIGLEHLEPGDLRVRRWGDVAEGTTFTRRVRPGQVLFGKRRAYQRKVAVADFDAVCSGDIYLFEANDSTELLPELLPFICQTDAFFDHAVGTSAGSLSPRTNWTSLAHYEFALPPLEEQRRILQVLEGSREAADCHKDLMAKSHSLKRAIVATHLSTLSGERKVKLASVAQIVRGSTPRPARDPRYFGGSFVPWITVGSITNGTSPFLTRTETMLTEEGARRSRLLKRGTVVLSNSGYSLGVPRLLGIDGCANDGVAAFLELVPSVNPLFLYYALWGMTDAFRQQIAAGGDQPNLNTQRIGAVKIPLPLRGKQDSLVEILLGLDEAMERTEVRRELTSNKMVCSIFEEIGM